MKIYHGAIIGLALAILAVSAAAQTQPSCVKRSAAIKHLGQNYSEIPVATGLTNKGTVLEILSSKTGKNWTIMVTMPNGTACMIAAGENWQKIPFTKKIDPKS